MKSFKEQITSTIEDRTHGSSELLKHIITTIGEHPNVSTSQLRAALEELRQVDPSMIIVHHFLNSMEKIKETDLREEIKRYHSKWRNVNDRIFHKLTSQFNLEDCTILTHSRSGTVMDVLRRSNAKTIIQTISKPGEEGRLQAEDLRKSGKEVALIEDHEVNGILSSVDLCIFGCDQYNERAFINKVGTALIIEHAQQYKIPTIVLADSRKKVSVLASADSPFEVVPLNLIIDLISEE